MFLKMIQMWELWNEIDEFMKWKIMKMKIKWEYVLSIFSFTYHSLG